jgi:predicted Zn-dependent peptidase
MPTRRLLVAGLLCAALLMQWAFSQAAKPQPAKAQAAKEAAKGQAAKAQPAKAQAATRRSAAMAFTEHKLKNGLRVILSEDHSAPTYSIALTYNVGSRDERKGRTGFAHLFEHMMFQGSENVGKGEHFILIFNNGGNMNGTTNADRTNYFQTLPANQLDLGLFLESDRMRSLAINQANLDNQRSTVQEERRLGVDNRPYGKTFETVSETAYDNFAYQHSTIGSMADLSAASREDVAAFFKTYYAPNNAVLTLVGDFKSGAALGKVRKYFESIPAQTPPPAPDMTEPEQMAERRKTIEDTFAPLPRIDIVYKIPAGNTPDYYALEVLGSIIGGGQSSRLYQTLVKERQLAASIYAGAGERRGPGLGQIVVTPQPGKDLAEIEKAIYQEIERVKNEPAAEWELEKIRMMMRRQRAQMLQSTLFRAILLGQFAVYYNDPGLVNVLEQKRAAVTREDLQRVARKYLNDKNRTVIITMPKKAAPAGKPAA